ncbi:hypothetical protein [Prochlorococcus sp. MIT 1223]|uniref:hypothetical protein n=1 Tax=Prochlorococcus sp. MIT 1223 TaxID=3096217 RepID=UPI002A761A9E|nr:hypothetical protein [Prochlorococcus sp. MIT 1223]
MDTKSTNVETSIEFAIYNALDRISLLQEADIRALTNEYGEWLSASEKEIEILVIEYLNDLK